MKRQTASKQLVVGTVLAAALVLAPGRAAAQQKNVEISGGYSFLHGDDVEGENGLSVPAGWYASGGGYVNNWLGIVGEVSGHYKTVTEFSEFGVDGKTRLHIFGAGPKFALRRNPRFTPYVQALFGAGRVNASVSFEGENIFDESISGFAYQPSGGVDINNRSGSVGVRVAVARAAIRSEGEWAGNTLFVAGVVIRR
jgi:hypothetical protein